jgi:hypothetical protein
MKLHRFVVLGLAAALVAGVASAAEKLESGPQVGKSVPGPFEPLNVTGKEAGNKYCLYCSNGSHPVAMIFAREVSPELKTLITKIDAATVKHSDAKMGSFVVFLGDEEDKTFEKDLKKMADEAGLKKIVLSIHDKTGPAKYKIAKEADVTVVLYTDHEVKANYAFKKGELKAQNVEQIVADVSKILPTDK